MAKGNQKQSDGSALDFEAQLWAAAEQAVPASHYFMAEYNGARPEGLCLGLIFLKYISDAFEEKREQLLFGFSDPKSEWFIKDEPQRAEAAENRDEYIAANVFWLPPEARWHTIKAKAKSPEIGKVIDEAMIAIERENPPFNMSDWGGENLRSDVLWTFGMSPVNNANYAWIQHSIHYLPPGGVAGFVMANGSMSTQTSNEGEIRKALIEADLVDCMVALPPLWN
jgi:type I restriction-modification system DNA methylase subunit